MCSRQVSEPIEVQELVEHFAPEDIARSPGRHREPGLVLLGVAPHEVAEGAVVGDFLEPLQALNLLHGLDQGRQPAVHCENLVVDVDGDGEVVEDVSEVLPDHSVAVLGLALHVEAVVLGDGPGLVVAPDHGHPVGVLYLEQTQKGDYFHAVCSPVHVVAQEQVAGVRQLPAHFEHFQQVVELPMDVAHQADGRADSVHIFLLDQDVLEFVAQDADCLLFQEFAVQGPLDQSVNLKRHQCIIINASLRAF